MNRGSIQGDEEMATNVRKLLLPKTLARAGWALVESREDVEGVPYEVTGPKAELHRLLADAAGVALSVQPFSDPELDAGAGLEVGVRGDRVLRSYKDGAARIPGFLEDYAAVALGAHALYQLTFDRKWLERSRRLADAVVERFWDEGTQAFFDTASDAEPLVTRPRHLRRMRDRHLVVEPDRHRRQLEIDGVVVACMSTGASAIPAPAHASVSATGSALGLMLACPAAEPPCAPFSVNAATGPTVFSEIVNLIVPY